MSSSFANRIKALESRIGKSAERLQVHLNCSLGWQGPIAKATCNGHTWHAAPEEDEEQFLKRVGDEVDKLPSASPHVLVVKLLGADQSDRERGLAS